MTEPTRHQFTIPLGQTYTTTTPKSAKQTANKTQWLNANRNNHWGDKAPAVRTWREAARKEATRANIPTNLAAVTIDCYIYKNNKNHYDPANLAPTFKAIVDGLVENYGILPNDSYEYLDGPHPHHGGHIEKPHPGYIAVVITEGIQNTPPLDLPAPPVPH